MSHKREGTTGRKGGLWITLGLLMIAAALALVSYNLYDALRAERSAWQIINSLEETSVEESRISAPAEASEKELLPQEPVLEAQMEMPVRTVDGIEIVGILRIPALELELPIISQWSYPDLQTAPCRYSGSAYLNDLILCGHNYSSHFGRLKELREGELVTFTDMDGNLFTYEVAEQETLMPTSVQEMTDGDWDLTLFTCTVGGKSRVTVRCVLAEGEAGTNAGTIEKQ